MEQLESIIEVERANLASGEKKVLREAIDRIEARVLSREPSELVADGSHNQNFLLRLVKVGLELQNTDLLLILVAKLGLGQVVLVLQSLSQLPNDKSKPFALHFVAEHFQIDQPAIKQQILALDYDNNCDTIYDLKSIVKLLIETNEWKKASELSKDSDYGPSLNRLICSKLAQQYEAMENFYEALVNYETAETQLENSVRVIIKQFLDTSYIKLEEYCLTNESLNDFWTEFSSFQSGPSSSRDQREYHSIDAISRKRRVRSGIIRTNTRSDTVKSIADTLPERMRMFVNDSNNPKNWLNRRTLESVLASAACLDLSTRHHLSTLALHHCRSNYSIPRACALLLCLGESSVVLQLVPRYLKHSDASQLNFLLGAPDASAAHLIRLLRSYKASGKTSTNHPINRRLQAERDCQRGVFFSTLNLGLLDETMKYACDSNFLTDEYATKQVLDNLENFVATRHSGSLDRIDPTIRADTLSMLRHNMASERIPSSPVISIIIYCMALHIYKLDNSDYVAIPVRVIRQLETMFEQTSDCLEGSNFNATNSMVRSTSILVMAVKDKLEILSDSEIVRVRVKSLVETVACRCLVESQFKQAAMLQSQIEDHVSAIKSLMRLGDIDTVMNYSLLVCNITVERLTINYLRHLDVDSKTIEDFIAKSRQQQQEQQQ